MFLQLGAYKFEGIKLPQTWSGAYATNYAQIPIINGKPVVQDTGEKLVEFELSAFFSDEFCVPSAEVEALQLIRRNKVVSQLTGGDGINYGRHVITDITINNVRASDNGYVSSISATIKLLEYNTTKTTIKNEGKALKSAYPNSETPINPDNSPAMAVMADISEGNEAATQVTAELSKPETNYSKISTLCAKANAAWTSANDKVQDTKAIIRKAIALKDSITAAKNAAIAAKNAADIHNFNDLYAANTGLEQSVYFMNGAAAPVAAFAGSREVDQ